jgi:transcriptional regulator with XRE-family HTH domain
MLGERIKKRASDLGVTPKQIAEACGISVKSIYQWFDGSTKNLRPENLVIVARLLRTTERWLVFEEGPADRPDTVEALAPGESAVLDAWRALPIEHQLAMIATMRELRKQLDAQRWIPGVSGDRRATVR